MLFPGGPPLPQSGPLCWRPLPPARKVGWGATERLNPWSDVVELGWEPGRGGVMGEGPRSWTGEKSLVWGAEGVESGDEAPPDGWAHPVWWLRLAAGTAAAHLGAIAQASRHQACPGAGPFPRDPHLQIPLLASVPLPPGRQASQLHSELRAPPAAQGSQVALLAAKASAQDGAESNEMMP